MEKLEKKLKDEQEHHKSMVLFLVNERKQMLFEAHELKVQNGRGNWFLNDINSRNHYFIMHAKTSVLCISSVTFTGSSHAQETALLAEMRKEVSALRSERDQLRTALDAALSEVKTLKEVTSHAF